MLYFIHIGWHYIGCILYIQAGITQAVLYTHQLALYMQYFIHLGRHQVRYIIYNQVTVCCYINLGQALHMQYFIHLGGHYIFEFYTPGITQVVYMLHYICCIYISWHYSILYSQLVLYMLFYKLRQTLICCIIYAVFYKLRQALHMLYLIHLGRHYICCILYTQAGITQVVFYTYRLALHRLYCIHISWHYICSILYTQVDITYAILYTIR